MVHTKLQKKLLYRNGPCFILVSGAFICRLFPKLKPHFGRHKANYVVYPLLQSRGKRHHHLPEAPLLGYAVV